MRLKRPGDEHFSTFRVRTEAALSQRFKESEQQDLPKIYSGMQRQVPTQKSDEKWEIKIFRIKSKLF